MSEHYLEVGEQAEETNCVYGAKRLVIVEVRTASNASRFMNFRRHPFRLFFQIRFPASNISDLNAILYFGP